MAPVLKKSMIQEILDEREPRVGLGDLSQEDKLLIIWGVYRGWTTKRIAEKVPTSVQTVLKHQQDWYERPRILDLPVLTQLRKRQSLF